MSVPVLCHVHGKPQGVVGIAVVPSTQDTPQATPPSAALPCFLDEMDQLEDLGGGATHLLCNHVTSEIKSY